MSEFFDLMIKPFVACLILTIIHAYLGLHVVKRGVIFVDLALAQMAALGASVGFLFGFALHDRLSYWLSLSFTLLGAALFASFRHRKPVVPQEALIGIIYAISAAASILVLSRSPDGGEELKMLMVGHLLFIDWPEIIHLAVLYGAIGLIHYLVRRPLLKVSGDPEGAFASGMHVRLWDFLFYGTFGVVVTSSTEIAGVLLVFSFLIVPAVCGVLLGTSDRQRLLIGWVCGMLTSVAGITLSYHFDLPTGAAVVCTFGICLVVCALIRQFLIGVPNEI
jgi:zinc/manganese transport system permease protein